MKKQNNVIYISIAFIIPILLMTIVYAILGMYPFGNKTLFTNDMSYEYVAFFSYYGSMLRGNEDLFYSFSKVIGGDMAGLFGYYLLSPFNLLAVFFEPPHMPIFILIITLLKIGMSGLTMNLYLNHKNRNIASILFSTSYALMAYNVAYQQNIIWLDGVILLPLLIWGIDNILEGKALSLYIGTLTLALISSFYIGYMLCIFSVLYFSVNFCIFLCVKKSVKRKNVIITYIFGSFISGGLAAVSLIPTALSLRGGKSEIHLSRLLDFELLHRPEKVLLNLLPGIFDIQGGTFHSPNIYCGVFIVVLSFVYFISRKIDWRFKLANGILVFILFLSFLFKNFELVWHGLELPTGYPHRFSFIFSCLLIIVAYCGWTEVVLYTRLNKKNFVFMIIFVISMVELSVNSIAVLKCFNYHGENEYRQSVQNDFRYIQKIEERDISFYRMEDIHGGFGMNSPMLLHYRGLASSYSGEKLSTKQLAGNLGMNEKATWIAYHDQMSVGMESLLNLKYLISNQKNHDFYKLIEKKDDIYLYENPFVLPLGVLADRTILNAEIDNRDMFAIQNEVWNSILRTQQPLYVAIPAEEVYREDDGVSYEFIIDRADVVYTNFFNEGLVDICEICVNGEKLTSFFPEKMPYRIGKFQKGDRVRVNIRSESKNINWYDLYFYYEDISVLDLNIARIRDESYKITQFDEHSFKGTITNSAEEERYLLFTIPNDKGWKIWLDGKRVEAQTVLGSLICVNIPKGQHELNLRFSPSGLNVGATLSICSLALLILWKRGRTK